MDSWLVVNLFPLIGLPEYVGSLWWEMSVSGPILFLLHAVAP